MHWEKATAADGDFFVFELGGGAILLPCLCLAEHVQKNSGLTCYTKNILVLHSPCVMLIKNEVFEIAHVQKFTKANTQGLSNHLDRKTKNHSNEDIDIERTHLNYDLCEKEGDTLSRLNERLEEVYCMNRKDVKVCCSWIVTLPENLKDAPDEHQRKFFEETHGFLTDRYGGEKNVLSANVHNDETTSHMHFAFVPVVWDGKKEREKVSAKEVITRNELKAFHQDLDKHLKTKIPEIYREGILNGKTIGLEDIQTIKKYSEEIEQEKEKMAADLGKFKEPKKVFEKVDGAAKNVRFMDKVILPKKEYGQLKELSLSSIKIHNQFERYKSDAKEKIKSLEESTEELGGKNKNLEQQNTKLKEQNQTIQKGRIEQQRKAVVYKSILEDKEPDLEISELEFKGRLILHSLERDGMPKSKEEGQHWLGILEENKKNETIPQNRLEKVMDKLKLFLDKFIKRVKTADFSLDGLKEKDKEIKQQPKRRRNQSHGMEL